MKLNRMLCIVLLGVLVSACSPSAPTGEPTVDIAAIRTSAASTVVSQFTLTAAAFTPTPAAPTATETPGTPPPAEGTITVTAGATAQVTAGTVAAFCDSLQWIADVTVPDDTTMAPGQDFIKTWRVKNTGSCSWGAGYTLVYAGYTDQMSGQAQPLGEVVQPGQEVEVSVQFSAPDDIGEYLSAWQMANPAGVEFEEIIFVRIIVE